MATAGNPKGTKILFHPQVVEQRALGLLKHSTNLPSAVWSNLGSVITATGTNAAASDLIGGKPRRFYRVDKLP